MKHIKVLLLLICLLSMTALISGCWNYREVENLAIVSGLAIDKKDDGYLVTTEIIDIKGVKESKISTKLLSVEGPSIFDAVRNTIKIAGKRLYFSHAKVVVINRKIAEEGLIPVMDWLGRDNEPRYTLYLLISKENSAEEILSQYTITSEVPSFELNEMLKAERSLSNTLEIEEWEFINDLAATGISATLPTVDLTEYNGKLTPEITGTGVFKKDKLVGFLDAEETKTMMFIKDKIKGGLLTRKEYEDSTPTNISLEIYKNKTKLKPHYANGKITMEINTSTDVSIGEIGGEENYIDEAGRIKMKENFEASLENSIKTLVKKVQEEYGSDIFGFGKTVKLDMPDVWKQIEPQWEQLYKDVHVEVHSTMNIMNSAFQSKPIKVGD